MRADEHLPSDCEDIYLEINGEILLKWAEELGFAQAALCGVEDFSKEAQRVQSQEPLAERRQLRFCVRSDEERAKSLAVLLWPYLPASQEPSSLFVDSYYQASNAAYHAARSLEERLISAGRFAKANVSYPAKAAAVRAGLGFIGRNDLLFTEKYGTRVVIILMLTDIDPSASVAHVPHGKRTCLQCGRCAAACPSGALDENGMSHPQRCLRNFMMEGVVVPDQFKSRIGMRLLGCDICQRVCPMQPDLETRPSSGYKLEDFVTLDQHVFSCSAARLAKEIGRNAARPQRIRAQSALLAGNSGNSAYLPVLRQWAQTPFEAVSAHAKWAIDRLELAQSGT